MAYYGKPPLVEQAGGTSESSYAQGDILYASAANTLSKLPIGTNGQVITSNGTVPGWAAGGGGTGSRTLIQSQVISSSVANVVFNSGISGYTYYELEALGVTQASGNSIFYIQFTTSGGLQSTNYAFQQTGGGNVQGQSYIEFAYSSSSTQTLNGLMRLYNLNSNTLNPMAVSQFATGNTNGATFSSNNSFSGTWNGTGPITAITITNGGSNMTSGTFRLFGVS
jgi:hypothetical protein